jgi:peptidoglycan/xylan/chitin deacetylase (PgdA/CDA1 family)
VRAVITYHSIDPSGSAISINETDFQRHLEWLASSGVPVVPLEALVAADPSHDAIALTFDDGFQNFGTIAMPLLRDHGLSATLFIVTERVGGTNAWKRSDAAGSLPVLPLLDWGGIAAVAEAGITIGSHGKTHRHLPSLDEAELEDEVSGSLEDFRRELGLSPTAFCYSYGDVKERERGAAARAYRVAVTAELRALDENEDAFMVPRVDACYLRPAGRLEAFGTPAFERYLKVRRGGRRLRRGVVRLLGRPNE